MPSTAPVNCLKTVYLNNATTTNKFGSRVKSFDTKMRAKNRWRDNSKRILGFWASHLNFTRITLLLPFCFMRIQSPFLKKIVILYFFLSINKFPLSIKKMVCYEIYE